MPKTPQYKTVAIDKLIHGGQGIGTLENNQKALVWNALPGERVRFRVTKKRSDYVEGIAEEIIEQTQERIVPKDELYLSTSPWQIMDYANENSYKQQILSETMKRAHVPYTEDISMHAPKDQWQYRNKMEYSFWGDERGLHLALFNRGSHRKQIVTGSSIARPEIDAAANKLCQILNRHDIRAGDLKSVIIRCSAKGEVVMALFSRNEAFPQIRELEAICQGIIVVYSNPKSPASVRTKDLYQYGDISLTDRIRGKAISYDAFSFFQVNLEIFDQAMQQIEQAVGNDQAIDLYSGVGTIGISISSNVTHIIESDAANISWAKKNAQEGVEVVHATSESALEYIDSKHTVILDPPRAGLHADLTNKLLEKTPPKIIYLSCNPSTQARDLRLLSGKYKIENITGYNFFPRTPHIESLAILVRE